MHSLTSKRQPTQSERSDLRQPTNPILLSHHTLGDEVAPKQRVGIWGHIHKSRDLSLCSWSRDWILRL